MYTTGMGRFSGMLHLAVQYPKIMTCVAFLGLAGWSGLGSHDLLNVMKYCNHPTTERLAMVPDSARSTVEKVCRCLHDKCSTMQ